MYTTKVKWLMDGKRQTNRLGAWVSVKEGEVSDHPTDQLYRLKSGVHYEVVSDEAPKAKPVSSAPVKEKSPEKGSDGVMPEAGKLPLISKPADEKPKKRGKRRIIKSKE